MNRSNLYSIYKGNNVLFTGVDIEREPYASPDLQFGYFYKTHIDPFIIRNVSNRWQLGFPRLKYDNHTFFQFDTEKPYYFSENYPEFEKKKVRIFFKYNNPNLPFYVATITP